jgi:hypothetical protein
MHTHNKGSQHNVPQQLNLFNSAFTSIGTTISTKDLLWRLNNATYVCRKCGVAFSHPISSGGLFATFHAGHCDVCHALDVPVTSVRDYGYLRHGIKVVEKLLLVEETKAQEKPNKHSRRKSDSLVGNFMDLCDKKGI